MTSTNVPDPTEAFLLSENESKIIYRQDNRRANSGIISMIKEDHTMGASIKSNLLQDQRVIFAGYRMPHPLEHVCNIQIQTTDETDPLSVTIDALEDLGAQTSSLIDQVTIQENAGQ